VPLAHARRMGRGGVFLRGRLIVAVVHVGTVRPAMRATERLRLTPRSVVVAVAMFGATITLLAVAAAARRVLGWIVVAAVFAALLHPLVSFLARRMRRGLAVLVVMVGFVGGVSAVVYGLVDNVARGTRRLQEAAPELALQLEQSRRWGELAREFRLAERTERFVDEAPERLRGGTPAEALRAAGSRGVAFLATIVLTIFFLLHGPRIVHAGLGQLRDPDRRERLRAVGVAVYRRAFGYATGSLARGLAAGLFGYAMARTADVPGPAPLGIWMGLWALAPTVGAAVGALPILALAAVASGAKAAWLLVAFVGYQVVENRLVERPIERATVRIGPFLTLAGGLVGLELSGFAGALLAVLALTMVVVALEELSRKPGPALKLSEPPDVVDGDSSL